jgi:AmpD protein
MSANKSVPFRFRFLPSPHHRSRGGAEVELIVVHYISCPPGSLATGDVEALFLGMLDPAKHPAYREVAGRELSAHFVVDRAGRVTQFVATDRAAYHAGASRWRGREGCNDFSIGIELIGGPERDFTARQYASLARLCCGLMREHPKIRERNVVGHSQIAVPRGRKVDPGPRFDWGRLRRDIARLQKNCVPVRRGRGPDAPDPRRCSLGAAPRRGAPPSRHPSHSR